MTTREIPTLSYTSTRAYPDPGTRLGAAWKEAYEMIVESGEDGVDGYTVAEQVAPKHDLVPATLIALFTRMATAGKLRRDHRPVETTRGSRKRTHYRA